MRQSGETGGTRNDRASRLAKAIAQATSATVRIGDSVQQPLRNGRGDHIPRIQREKMQADQLGIGVDVVLPSNQERPEQAYQNSEQQKTVHPLARLTIALKNFA